MDNPETHLALGELVARYASHADRRRDAALAELFTADGRLVIEWGGEQGTTVT